MGTIRVVPKYCYPPTTILFCKSSSQYFWYNGTIYIFFTVCSLVVEELGDDRGLADPGRAHDHHLVLLLLQAAVVGVAAAHRGQAQALAGAGHGDLRTHGQTDGQTP